MRKLLYILIGLVTLTSCNNDRGELEDETQVVSAKEIVTSSSLYNQVFTLTQRTIDNIEIEEQLKSGQTSFFSDSCADVVYYLSQDLSYVENVIISYNDFSCAPVGQRRIGKIHVYLTGLISEQGTEVTVILDDFHIEHHKIEGTQISTNIDVNGFIWEFDQTVENGRITFPSGDYALWESDKYIRINLLTKKYIQILESNGVNSQGMEYEVETLIPLEKSFTCDFIDKGSLLIELEDYDDMIIDYGNGTCDDQATITLVSDEYESFDFTLK